MTFGGTPRSKVGQASSGNASSGNARRPMVGLYSRESATREFAGLNIPISPSHISPGCTSSLQ